MEGKINGVQGTKSYKAFKSMDTDTDAGGMLIIQYIQRSSRRSLFSFLAHTYNSCGQKAINTVYISQI